MDLEGEALSKLILASKQTEAHLLVQKDLMFDGLMSAFLAGVRGMDKDLTVNTQIFRKDELHTNNFLYRINQIIMHLSQVLLLTY